MIIDTALQSKYKKVKYKYDFAREILEDMEENEENKDQEIEILKAYIYDLILQITLTPDIIDEDIEITDIEINESIAEVEKELISKCRELKKWN